MNPITLDTIDTAARRFADELKILVSIVTEINEEIETLKRRKRVAIRNAVNATATRHSELMVLISSAPALFQKPRTVIMHGIKVGLAKGKGGITWDDEARVIKLIEKHFPEQVDILIKTTKKPLKKALNSLSVEDLRRIGCTVAETGDTVVITPADSDIDKLVDALLGAATETEEEKA